MLPESTEVQVVQNKPKKKKNNRKKTQSHYILSSIKVLRILFIYFFWTSVSVSEMPASSLVASLPNKNVRYTFSEPTRSHKMLDKSKVPSPLKVIFAFKNKSFLIHSVL